MSNKDYSTYKNTYAKLIRLYPSKFRERFAEPMLQTFGDMCWERQDAGEDLRSFVIKTYAQTLFHIIKEQLEEVVMNVKHMNKRTYIVMGVISLVILAGVMFAILLNRGSGLINPGSTLQEVEKLSQGEKVACIQNNEAVRKSVKADDVYIGDEKEFSKFETEVASGIIDVPAGTELKDITTGSYEQGIVRGSALYGELYGNYNFEAKYLNTPGEWKLVSLKACEEK
ncbi:MAG TPA: hypothetical protein PKD20_05500 [Candidatus Saccharibacteria bacterium]|jgi:hypothetical protein|nr:hypothetical protein [Candidatus Saccharibacteria bacterium]HMT56297.1 hypothetical protein [Candidatus Saccharibacteria bacterium]